MMSLQKGDKVPAITLKDQYGNDYDLSSLAGISPFVVFFYPKDFTPGCTKEACAFRDRYEEFRKLGAEVIGISSDSENTHRRFSEKNELPYILLSDINNNARRKFGVQGYLFGLLPGRETFVFDKSGKLIFNFNSIQAATHIDKAMEVLNNYL